MHHKIDISTSCGRSAAASSLLGCIAFALASASMPANADILIGQSIARSGSLAQQGEAIVKGSLAYINRINASGGVNGERIVLKTLDDGGDSRRAVDNARQLIGEGVVVLFGMAEGGPCTAILPVVTEAKIPLVACMAGSPQLREPFNRYVFPVRAAHLDEFASLLSTAAGLGNKTVALIYSDSENGRLHLANVTRVAKERGMEMLLPIAVPGNPDMKAIAKRLVASKVDVVLNHGGYSSYADLIRETRALGPRPLFLAVNSGGQELARLAGPAGKGTIMSQIAPFPNSRATPVQRKYEDDLKKSFPGEPFGWSSMEGYLSAVVLIEGLKRAGRHPTHEVLVTAFEKMGRVDLGGYEVKYGPNDRTGSTFVDITFIKADGKFIR